MYETSEDGMCDESSNSWDAFVIISRVYGRNMFSSRALFPVFMQDDAIKNYSLSPTNGREKKETPMPPAYFLKRLRPSMKLIVFLCHSVCKPRGRQVLY